MWLSAQPWCAWPKIPVLKPVHQALSYLLRVMPSEASPSHKNPPLHSSTIPSWKVQHWGQLSALALPHIDLFVQQRVKNMHINMQRLGKSPGQPFRWFPSSVRFHLIFAPLVLFFSQHSWLSLCISVQTSWLFSAKGWLERVDRNLLRIVIWGRVS